VRRCRRDGDGVRARLYGRRSEPLMPQVGRKFMHPPGGWSIAVADGVA
jgi:hypothetical protein